MRTETRRPAHTGLTVVFCCLVAAPVLAGNEEHALLDLMRDELDLSMEKLVSPEGVKPYFIQYAITDVKAVGVAATLGALTGESESQSRQLDVDVRCGNYDLDNTRQIRGGYSGYDRWRGAESLPLNGDPLATQHTIWLATDSAFKSAAKRLAQVKANLKVKVEEEDPADDFSREASNVQIDPWVSQQYDLAEMSRRVKDYSKRFRTQPKLFGSSVSISGNVTNRLAVNSEESRLQFGRGFWRISIQASTVADDGMELFLHDAFDAATPSGLPGDDIVIAAIDKLIAELLTLRDAPLVDPYTGPAILLNRASGVFFHEIFGHRIEGHRQKDVDEGQTFAKKLGKQVLPKFLSVTDDPSLATFNNIDLNGHYAFDDECVRGQATSLVKDGVLKTFLMSRSPTRGITKSNGHGRRQPGRAVVARQGNLTVSSTKQVPFEELRKMLIAECAKQDKDFGLLFRDISGGFTTTQRYGPQAFKVIPLIVYRIYTDGRPDELVRGVDLVGTPLTSFSKILCTANDADVFNGFCGAESGSVPVSAISPSILVEQIEVEKKQKAQNRPPILAPPIAEKKIESVTTAK